MGMDYDEAIRATEDGLEYIDLFDDPFLLVVPRDDPLADEERIGLAELRGRRILGGPPWASDLRERCRSCGFEPRFDLSYRTTDFNAFQGLVAAGLGITLVPRLVCGSIRDDVVALPLDRGPVRRVKLALREEGYRSPASAAMQMILEEAAGALAASNA